MRLRKNDTVMVITGRDKGKSGQIIQVDTKKNRVKVAGVQMVKKHQKPSQANTEGSIKTTEAFFHVSNVAFIGKSKKAVHTKVGFKFVNGKKRRIARKTGKEI